MNVFTFSGNLGGDAETRFLPDGKPVTTFSVASTAGYGDRQETTWIRCNAWGERYQKIAPYLTKGKRVTVSGEFTQREWQAQDGTTKYSCEVRVADIDLPPRSDDAPRQQHQAPSQNAPTQQYAAAPPAYFGDFDDSIPF